MASDYVVYGGCSLAPVEVSIGSCEDKVSLLHQQVIDRFVQFNILWCSCLVDHYDVILTPKQQIIEIDISAFDAKWHLEGTLSALLEQRFQRP